MEEPKPGEIYVHFKSESMKYEIVAIAIDSDHVSKVVVYKQLYEGPDFPIGTLWVRKLEEFNSFKALENGEKVKRFRLIHLV